MSKIEEQAKDYFKSITGFEINSETVYQNKKGSCQIYLLNILTDFADEHTSQQLAEREKVITTQAEELKKLKEVLSEVKQNWKGDKLMGGTYERVFNILTPKQEESNSNKKDCNPEDMGTIMG